MKYFNSIQLLRFVGASFVLLAHMGIGAYSYKGMDLLFTISGFVIYLTGHQHFGQGFKAATIFLKRRFIRIFTFYWLLFFSLIGLGIYKVPYDWSFIKNVLLIPGHKSFLEVTWSLSYELYFYSLFAGLIFLLNKQRSRQFLIGIWCLTFAVLCLQWTKYSLMGSQFNFLVGQNIWQILTGSLACMFYLEISAWPPAKWLRYSWGIFVLGLGLFFSVIGYYTTSSFMTTSLGSACLVVALVSFEANKTISFPAIVVHLGNASYVAYLIHIPIIHYFSSSPELKATNQWLILLAVWMLSLFLHRFIEQPLVSRLSRR